MNEELIAITRAATELELAAREFATAVGQTGPVQEFVSWITHELRYRFEPRKARILMRAAEEIKAIGLPARAVEDRLLRTVLEEGSLERDEGMQDRWARLLANAATADKAPHVAFPSILAQLSPTEARMLDAMHSALDDEISVCSETNYTVMGFDPSFFAQRANVDQWSYPAASANLVRLRLADSTGRNELPAILHSATHYSLSFAIQMTYFGATFVVACLPPGTPSAVTMLQKTIPD